LTPPEITKLLRAKVASIVGPGLWFSDMFRIYNLLRFGNLHKDHQAQLRQLTSTPLSGSTRVLLDGTVMHEKIAAQTARMKKDTARIRKFMAGLDWRLVPSDAVYALQVRIVGDAPATAFAFCCLVRPTMLSDNWLQAFSSWPPTLQLEWSLCETGFTTGSVSSWEHEEARLLKLQYCWRCLSLTAALFRASNSWWFAPVSCSFCKTGHNELPAWSEPNVPPHVMPPSMLAFCSNFVNVGENSAVIAARRCNFMSWSLQEATTRLQNKGLRAITMEQPTQ